MGVNFRKDVANLEATFPALSTDFNLPDFIPKDVGLTSPLHMQILLLSHEPY
jgi:hypothetical protein